MNTEKIILNEYRVMGMLKVDTMDYLDADTIRFKEETHGINEEFKATDFDKGVLTVDTEFYISPLGTRVRYEYIKAMQTIFKAFQGKRDGKHFRLFECKKDFPLLFVCGELGILIAPVIEDEEGGD